MVSSSVIKTFLSELTVLSPMNIPIKGISFLSLLRRKSSMCSSIKGMIFCRVEGSEIFSSIVFSEKNSSATILPARAAIVDCFFGKIPCTWKPRIDLGRCGRNNNVKKIFITSQQLNAEATGMRNNCRRHKTQLKQNPDSIHRDLPGG